MSNLITAVTMLAFCNALVGLSNTDSQAMATVRISSEKRGEILRLLDLGWSGEDIAREVEVTPRQVAAVKAHVTMHSYDKTRRTERAVTETLSSGQLLSPTPEQEGSISELLDRLQRGLSSVAVPVGREVTTGRQVYWDPNPDYGSANPHLMIIGESGFGKTYAIQCLVAELALRRIPSIVIDYGRGFDVDAAPKEFINLTNPVEVLAGVHGININPLQIYPTDINGPLNVAVRVSDSFSRVYRIGVQQHAMLRDVIVEVFEDRGIQASESSTWLRSPPFLSDVDERLGQIATDRFHRKAKVALSLRSHISTFFIFNTFRSSGDKLDWDALTDKNGVHIMQLRGLEGRTQQVVTEFLLWDLYHYMLRTGSSPLRLYCVLDEAHNLSFDKDTPVDRLIREARKFGIGLIFASQQPRDFSDTAYGNASSKLMFQTLDESRRVSRKIVNKCNNVKSANALADILAQLPRGRAFLVTRNYGFNVAITSLQERMIVSGNQATGRKSDG